MTHHEDTGTTHETPGAPHSSEPAGRTEWEEVKSSLDELGEAMSRWANSVKDDPENRRHARDIKEQFESMGHDIGRALDSAADSEFVKGMGDAAGKAGEAFTDAAKTVGREVTPFVATAFRTAAEGIRVVADKIEDTSRRRHQPHGHSATAAPPSSEATPPAAEPVTPTPPSPTPSAAPSVPPAGAEPPAPAPSGIHPQPDDAGEH